MAATAMRCVGAFVVFWLWAAVAPVAAVTAADAILTQANGALASGQYEAAQTLVTGGLAEKGLDALSRSRLLVVRGLAQQAQGRASEALVDFTLALQGSVLVGEERARALFARGLGLDGLGRLDPATGDYNAALALVPRATYALNNRANVYRRQGRFAEARRDYNAALQADTPNPQYPYFGLGQIAEAEGDLSAARELYRKAVAADPGYGLALARLQALGTRGEADAIRPDTGVIVLQPPRGRDETVVLRPPPAAIVPVAKTGNRPVPSPAEARPGQGLPLRPAIVEGTSRRESQVQLGAWRSMAEARQGWAVARDAARPLLDGVAPVIVTADLPARGRFYRLRIGAAPSFCAQLQAKGVACIPARD